MTQKTVNEQQAIEIALAKGLTVTQLDTKHYQDKGFIQSGAPLDSFIKTLEQIYEKVTLKKNPKTKKPFVGLKRKYILKNERPEIAKRDDKRLTVSSLERQFADSVLTMLQAKQNDENDKAYSAKHWANYFGLQHQPRQGHLSKLLLKCLGVVDNEAFKQLFNEKFIVRNIIKSYTDNIAYLVEKTFNLLEREGKIKTSINYKGVCLNDDDSHSVVNIDKKVFQAVADYRNYSVKNVFGSFGKFKELSSSESSKAKDQMLKFNRSLNENIGFHFVYRNIVVEVLEQNEVSEQDLMLAKAMAKKMGTQSFMESTQINKSPERLSDKFKDNPHLIGYAHNAFAIELTEAVMNSRKRVIRLDDEQVQKYIAQFNKNMGTNYKLNIIAK